jgi:kinesin family protein C1
MRNVNSLRDLQSQVASLESTQAASTLRLAQDMNAERAKVAELQADHRALSRELASSKAAELDKRRQLVNSSDEIEKTRMKHAREIMELEMDIQKRARETRELTEELRCAKEDLEREREVVSTLKSTVSHQSTAQITLNAQVNALQVEKTALQAQLDAVTSTVSQRTLDQQAAMRRIAELEAEAREAELIRRKLHNMVQELKGNIRVFCRVRPVLPHEFVSPSTGLSRSDSSSGRSPNSDNQDKGLVADVMFPDKRDHREIVLTSSSSSAMGQERKEVHNFSFDRVSGCALTCISCLIS